MKSAPHHSKIRWASVHASYRRRSATQAAAGPGMFLSTPLPFQIPLGALIPQRMENLLPACKNLGVTHLTNGCYRLHPVEWNVGEAAGSVGCLLCHPKSEFPAKCIGRKICLWLIFKSQLTREGVPA